MKISVDGAWGIIDGTTRIERKQLSSGLQTQTRRVGDRLRFAPTRYALDHLVAQDAVFDAACREAWAHFYAAAARVKDLDSFFDFKTKPYEHQLKVFSIAKDKDYFAFEHEMGCGKTKIVLDLLAYKYLQGEINGALIITVRGVHQNWVTNEAPVHFGINYKGAAWSPTRVENGMRGIMDTEDFALATINYDAVPRKKGKQFCEQFLTSRKCAIVLDESHAIKNPSANRTKAVLKLASMADIKYTMTGTPVSAGPLDVWAPYTFLSPRIMNQMSFYQFKSRYAIEKELPGITYKKWVKGKAIDATVRAVVGYKNVEELKSRIEPYRSRVLKDDVLDLPDKVYRKRLFELSADARKAYTSMSDELCVELKAGSVTADSALVMLTRLQQIACEFIPQQDGQAVSLGEGRINACMDVILQTRGSVVIWVSYKHVQRELRERLSKADISHHVLTGDTATDVRMDIVNAFQAGEGRVLIASPQVAGTGFTLTAARDVIFFHNRFSLPSRLQAEDRTHRIGQIGTVTYTDLLAINTVDFDVLDSLIAKRDIASTITGDVLRQWLTT